MGDLMDSARSAVFSMLGIVTRNTGFEAQQHLRAWGSIYRARTFNQPDIHSGNSWSGIYCVQAAELGAEHSKLAGRISFHDPRNRLTMAEQSGPGYKSTVEVRPRDGMMVIFPSWLQCHVNPFVSDSAILLICFESRITGLAAGLAWHEAENRSATPYVHFVSTQVGRVFVPNAERINPGLNPPSCSAMPLNRVSFIRILAAGNPNRILPNGRNGKLPTW
jgi:hypothetical protein